MVKYCIDCGMKLLESAKFCSDCGIKQNKPKKKSTVKSSSNNNSKPEITVNDEFDGEDTDEEMEEPSTGTNVTINIPKERTRETKQTYGFPAFLSFLLPGVGQIVKGELGRGIKIMLLAILFGFLIVVGIGLPLYLIVWIYSIYDAYTAPREK